MKAILISTALLFIATSADIVRRHDKNDSEYLALGAKYPAVCIVGKNGGDGTLVADRWVITAGHVAQAMDGRTNGRIEIYFSNREEPYISEAVFMHHDFKVVEHDIALIRLSELVRNVTPLPLYDGRDEAGRQITIVGHGYSKNGNDTKWETDGRKRGATNTVDRVTQNFIQFDFDRPDDPDVTPLEGTAGSGDSGGPALLEIDNQMFIAGISSAGEPGEYGPATYGAQEYYTRVSTHLGWVEDVLNGRIQTSSSPMGTDGEEAVIVREFVGAPPGMFKELGLILDDSNGNIEIHGKIDELVPAGINKLSFRPPSYIVGVNETELTSLAKFRAVFDQLKKGDSYELLLELRGEMKRIKLVR